MHRTILRDETPPNPILEQLDADQRWASAQRRHRLLTAAVIVLAAVIAGAAWYAYPMLKNQGVFTAKFSGIEPLVNAMGDELKTANSKLADLSKNRDDLQAEMDKLGTEMRSRFESARKQTTDATAAMMSRVENQIDSQTSELRTRLANLESSHASDQERMAGMQQEVDRMRADVARQSEELAAARREMDNSNTNMRQQFTDLQQGQQRNRSDVDQIAKGLAVEYVRFEASKGRTQELAPGISLTLTGTNVNDRRVNGWMWVMPDRRTIWLHGQGAQQPVIFYGLEDGKRRELVITQVTRSSVVGYLIVPKADFATRAAGD